MHVLAGEVMQERTLVTSFASKRGVAPTPQHVSERYLTRGG